jgi:outer membrane protein assembly factor BamB
MAQRRSRRLRVAKNSGIAGAFSGSSLIFVGRVDGRLTALDCSNGTRLWLFSAHAQ